jgi:hypothetical protein
MSRQYTNQLIISPNHERCICESVCVVAHVKSLKHENAIPANADKPIPLL